MAAQPKCRRVRLSTRTISGQRRRATVPASVIQFMTEALSMHIAFFFSNLLVARQNNAVELLVAINDSWSIVYQTCSLLIPSQDFLFNFFYLISLVSSRNATCIYVHVINATFYTRYTSKIKYKMIKNNFGIDLFEFSSLNKTTTEAEFGI